jgi:quercetin dioxygenase-like cupin family protein
VTHSITDLRTLAAELLEQATSADSGRAARTLPHPVDGLRQTVIALRAGADLGEHESPGPASLLVMSGHVRILAGEHSIDLGEHQLSPVPDSRHSLQSDDDSVVVLSVALPQRAPTD